MDQQTHEAPHGLTHSIEQIVRVEEEAQRRRTPGEAVVERFVGFVGTLPFVLIHVAALAAWALVNVGAAPGVPAFDPPPFNLLSTMLAFESVLLTALVLMTQQRMNLLSDRRDHLDLQVNLLTERETTQILQLLHRVCERMDIPLDEAEEARQLAKPTSVEAMVGALHERYPDDEA
jgi:uncharacterized membrane protein